METLTRGLKLKRGAASVRMASVDASTAVRPGETHSLFTIKASPNVIALARRHTVTLNFCYCSIGDRCWTLRNNVGSNDLSVPQSAAFCKIGASINSPLTI